MARPMVKLSIGYQEFLLSREDAAQVAAILASAQAVSDTADYNKELGNSLYASYVTRDREIKLSAPPENLFPSKEAADEWIKAVRAAQAEAKEQEARAQAAQAARKDGALAITEIEDIRIFAD